MLCGAIPERSTTWTVWSLSNANAPTLGLSKRPPKRNGWTSTTETNRRTVLPDTIASPLPQTTTGASAHMWVLYKGLIYLG